MPAKSSPPSMPEIRPALLAIDEAGAALSRAKTAWNKMQLLDAIKSMRLYLDIAESLLP